MIIALSFTGCSTSDVNSKDKLMVGGKPEYKNTILPIYNFNNEKIGEIEQFEHIYQADDCIVYNKVEVMKNDYYPTIHYYKYDIATKKSFKLGTVKELSHQSSESALINDHLYLFTVTGEVLDREERILNFVDIDLKNNSMTTIYSDKSGFIYNTMIDKGDKVLLAKETNSGECYIEEYDTKTKEIKKLISFNFDNETKTGEGLRNVYADEDTISLLVLNVKTEDSIELRVDVYDNNMKFLHSRDISDITDNPNERRQGVHGFAFNNKYMYYENFSTTNFLGKLEDNKVEPLMEIESNFQIAMETKNNSKTKLFCKTHSREGEIYVLDLETGKIKESSFRPDDNQYLATNIYRNSKDDILILMTSENRDTNGNRPTRLYSMNLSDLSFD